MNTVAVWYRSTIMLCIQGQFHICSAGSYILGIGPIIFISPRRATIPQTCSGFKKIYLGVSEEGLLPPSEQEQKHGQYWTAPWDVPIVLRDRSKKITTLRLHDAQTS